MDSLAVHRAPVWRRPLLCWTAFVLGSCGSDAIAPPSSTPPVDTVPPPPVHEVTRRILAVDSTGQLAALGRDGSHRPLTDDPLLTPTLAVWSPSASHVAFLGRTRDTPTSPPNPGRFYVVDSTGAGLTPVSDTPFGVRAWPTWSPDGTSVAFGTVDLKVFVVGRDGSGQEELTPGELTGVNPDWSPTGDWIAYSGQDEAGRAGVFRVRPDGTDRTLLHEFGTLAAGVPLQYSPSGDHILASDGEDLFVVDAAGDGAVRLTSTPDLLEEGPRWSPDGSRIAYQVDGPTRYRVEVLDVSTGVVAAAFEDPNVDIMFPGWSPDGTEISLWIQNWIMVGDIESTAPPWDVLARGGHPSWWPGG